MLLLALLLAPARADGGVDDLLKSLPTIENPAAKAESQAPAPPPDMPFTDYVEMVRKQVLAGFQPKAGSVKKNPGIEARLVVQIDEAGAVSAIKPMVLSGDKKYDQAAVRAVEGAGTLPAPPPNLHSLAAAGVVVVFNGREWAKSR